MKASQGGVCICREALCTGTSHTGRCCLRWPLPCMGPCSPSTVWCLTAHRRLLPLRFSSCLICPREQSYKAGGTRTSPLALSFHIDCTLPHVTAACMHAWQRKGIKGDLHIADVSHHCEQAGSFQVKHTQSELITAATKSPVHGLQTQWDRLVAKPEVAQIVAEHEEGLSLYWLSVPFKVYAYWWSFAFAYLSGEVSDVQIHE